MGWRSGAGVRTVASQPGVQGWGLLCVVLCAPVGSPGPLATHSLKLCIRRIGERTALRSDCECGWCFLLYVAPPPPPRPKAAGIA